MPYSLFITLRQHAIYYRASRAFSDQTCSLCSALLFSSSVRRAKRRPSLPNTRTRTGTGQLSGQHAHGTSHPFRSPRAGNCQTPLPGGSQNNLREAWLPDRKRKLKALADRLRNLARPPSLPTQARPGRVGSRRGETGRRYRTRVLATVTARSRQTPSGLNVNQRYKIILNAWQLIGQSKVQDYSKCMVIDRSFKGTRLY